MMHRKTRVNLMIAVLWTCLMFGEFRWYRLVMMLIYWALFIWVDYDDEK